MSDDDQIEAIAVLGEPMRRRVYEWVIERPGPVNREQTATALGVTRALAAFHLDRLVDAGLLEADYRRPEGRKGPGAGRPAKFYRRSGRYVEVSLPPRRYEVLARLLARAVAGADDAAIRERLSQTAREFGGTIGRTALQRAGGRPGQRRLVRALEDVLEETGFEPTAEDGGDVRLRNCPFHALVEEHATLVCEMNLALHQGVVSELPRLPMEPFLDPRPGTCCVAFRPRRPGRVGTPAAR